MPSLLPSELYGGVYQGLVSNPLQDKVRRQQVMASQAEMLEMQRKQAQDAEAMKARQTAAQGMSPELQGLFQYDPQNALKIHEDQQKQKDAKNQARTQGLMGLFGLPEDQRAQSYPQYFNQLGGAESGLPEQYDQSSLMAMMHTGLKPETQADLRPDIPDAPKVGTLEDFISRTYGNTPTPQQIVQARKTWEESGRAPREGDKPPSGYRWASSGQLEPIPGGPASEERKPPTSTQFLAAGYGKRIEQAERDLDEISKTYDRASTAGAFQSILPRAKKPESARRQDQAERNFVNAVLRRESGAAIAPSEFESAELQYFPRWGDSPEVLAQKKRNREQTMQTLKAEAGKAWDKVPLVTAQRLTPSEAARLAELEALEGGN